MKNITPVGGLYKKNHEMYKILSKLLEDLGNLDITIIDYFPKHSDYLGNIRDLFMFSGPKNIEPYKHNIFDKDDSKKETNHLTTREISFINQFLIDLKDFVDFIKSCEVTFGMPLPHLKKTDSIINCIYKYIDKIEIKNNNLKFQ